MAEPTIPQQLKAIRAGDDAGAGALAASIASDCSRKTRDLLKILHGADATEAEKAADVVLALELHAFDGVLQGIAPDRIPPYVWDMKLLADLLAAARERLLKALDIMLDDKRDVPMTGDTAKMDEKPLPRRVCDEAYLMERALLAAESEDSRFLNSRMFLRLPVAERDQEIFFAKRRRRFTVFAEP